MDHVALLYLVSKHALTGKLARWMLLLQEFDFDIQHQPGTQHVITNYLSRIEDRADTVNSDDDFPDGEILHIEAEDPKQNNAQHEDKRLKEMSTFPSTGLPPPRMRTDGKKRLVVRSWNICLIQDTLYHKGSDRIWCTCIHNDKKEAILREAHCRIALGHYVDDATTRKVC